MICGNTYADYLVGNNQFFEDTVFPPMSGFPLMRREFLARGIEVNTPDVNIGRNVAFDLYIEGRPLIENDLPKYLIALENPNHNRLNEDRGYCQKFSKVFTWDTRSFDMKNVVRILPPHQIAHDAFLDYSQRDIFCCLINANKAFREKLPSDLYSERINVIRWYEKNVPDKFELYGRGWDKPPPAFDLIGKIRRSIPSLRVKLFDTMCFPSYMGELKNKSDVLSRSKFSFCYENNKDLSNYITEKIIDAFISGCVPIYWGADNILDYIPAECFIDRRNFKTTAEVHQYLVSMSPREYSQYQTSIADFLKSGVAKRFSFEHFVSIVVNEIAADFRL